MELKAISTISNTSTSRVRDLDKAGPLCTTVVAAQQLGVSPALLRMWQRLGRGPSVLHLQIGKRNVFLYCLSDLQEFALSEVRERGLFSARLEER